MNFPPQIYFLGAQKAGTTSLVAYLTSHPSLCVSEPKEPHYFTNNWHRGIEWYQSQFAHAKPNEILIDASTSYTMARLGEDYLLDSSNPYFNLANRINSLSKSPKFIYMLRDPVQRTYSAYWHRVRAGEEERSFQQAVIDCLDEKNFYVRPSLYAEQLKLFLKVFPIEDFNLLLFENFIKTPDLVINQICDFIGIEFVKLPEKKTKNASYNYSNFGKFLQIAWVNRLVKVLIKYLPEIIKNIGKRLVTKPIPSLSEKDRKILQQFYAPYNNDLATLTGINLSLWKY